MAALYYASLYIVLSLSLVLSCCLFMYFRIATILSMLNVKYSEFAHLYSSLFDMKNAL